VVARSDNTLSLLSPNADGQLVESLVFRDPRLLDVSALAVVDVNGSREIYATNAGHSEVVVLPFSEGVPSGVRLGWKCSSHACVPRLAGVAIRPLGFSFVEAMAAELQGAR
jgi:hypothetical protein